MTSKPLHILVTPALLEFLGASCRGLRRFRTKWPRGVRATRENIHLALRLGFDVEWFAISYFSIIGMDRWGKSRDEVCRLDLLFMRWPRRNLVGYAEGLSRLLLEASP